MNGRYIDDIGVCNMNDINDCSDRILTFGMNKDISPAKVGTGCLEFKLLASN